MSSPQKAADRTAHIWAGELVMGSAHSTDHDLLHADLSGVGRCPSAVRRQVVPTSATGERRRTERVSTFLAYDHQPSRNDVRVGAAVITGGALGGPRLQYPISADNRLPAVDRASRAPLLFGLTHSISISADSQGDWLWKGPKTVSRDSPTLLASLSAKCPK